MGFRSFGSAQKRGSRKNQAAGAPAEGNSAIIAGVLAVAVCAVIGIAYKNGTLNRIPFLSARLPATAAPPAADAGAAEAARAASVVIPPAEPAYFKRLREPEMRDMIRKVQTDPGGTNAMLRQALTTSFPAKKRSFTPEQFSYVRAFGEAANKAKDGEQSNDIFTYCLHQGATKVRARPGEDLDPLVAFLFVNDSIQCLMTRKPQQLCEPASRRRFVGQMEYYSGLRRRIVALTDPAKQAVAEAALEVGIHQSIRQELRKLASKGIISIKDFGSPPPGFVSETIGDVKDAGTECGL